MIPDQQLTARVEEYVEQVKEHHRRLLRWTTSVIPFPFIFAPRVLAHMSPAMRTGVVYAWGALVAVLGLGVCLSAWQFDRVHAVRCPVCRAKFTANPELYLRVGECQQCLFQRVRTAT